MACVKGLAEATGKGAIAVSNLEAIARYGRAPLRAAMLDARRGDIYAAVYDDQGRIVMPELVMKLPQFLETLPRSEVDFVSQDFTVFGDGPAAPRIVAERIGRDGRPDRVRARAPRPRPARRQLRPACGRGAVLEGRAVVDCYCLIRAHVHLA